MEAINKYINICLSIRYGCRRGHNEFFFFILAKIEKRPSYYCRQASVLANFSGKSLARLRLYGHGQASSRNTEIVEIVETATRNGGWKNVN